MPTWSWVRGYLQGIEECISYHTTEESDTPPLPTLTFKIPQGEVKPQDPFRTLPSRLHQTPKSPPPNIIHLQVKTSVHEWVGQKQTFKSQYSRRFQVLMLPSLGWRKRRETDWNPMTLRKSTD